MMATRMKNTTTATTRFACDVGFGSSRTKGASDYLTPLFLTPVRRLPESHDVCDLPHAVGHASGHRRRQSSPLPAFPWPGTNRSAMTVTIEFSNEQLAALKAKAAAQGLTLQDWLHKLADEAPEPVSLPNHSNRATACWRSMAPRRRLRKSTKTAERCSAALPKTSDDRRRRRHSRRALVSFWRSSLVSFRPNRPLTRPRALGTRSHCRLSAWRRSCTSSRKAAFPHRLTLIC